MIEKTKSTEILRMIKGFAQMGLLTSEERNAIGMACKNYAATGDEDALYDFIDNASKTFESEKVRDYFKRLKGEN